MWRIRQSINPQGYNYLASYGVMWWTAWVGASARRVDLRALVSLQPYQAVASCRFLTVGRCRHVLNNTIWSFIWRSRWHLTVKPSLSLHSTIWSQQSYTLILKSTLIMFKHTATSLIALALLPGLTLSAEVHGARLVKKLSRKLFQHEANSVYSAQGSVMGPVAFLWPADRPWSAQMDNIGPCGSSVSQGNRTDFPLGCMYRYSVTPLLASTDCV